MPENPCDLTAVEAVRAMRSGELRAEDYARALLERARSLSHLDAFIAIEPDAVLQAARQADLRRASGAPPGLLHGLPLPVKDSVNTKALPTTNGTRALRGFRPREDAAVLGRLFAQGAILMGKTNLHELSRGWTSNNGAFGAVRNPYDPARIPGGSSGGSAAAVAARMAPLAIAEDTWGSIRVPAAWCGTAGFRPTVGRYPNEGIIPLTHGRFDQVGPVARCVADLALFDRAAGGEAAEVQRLALRGARIAIPEEAMAELDPEVERVAEAAFARLANAGAVLVRVALPEQARHRLDIATTIIAYENPASIAAFLAEQGAGVTFEDLIAQASDNIRSRYGAPPPTAAEHRTALALRQALIAAIPGYFRAHGIAAIAAPALLAPAPPLGDNAEIDVGGAKLPIRTVVGRNTAMGNIASMASLVLPAGLTRAGLPVGLEFDAPAGSDRALLGLGFALEEALGPIAPPRP